jgi:adenylate kinase
MEIAVLLEADEDELVARLLQRAIDEGRDDDNEDTIRNRQRVYQAETQPLVDYYPEHGVPVVPVDGLGTIDDVFARVVTVLAEN